jgi:hypothetical protein
MSNETSAKGSVEPHVVPRSLGSRTSKVISWIRAQRLKRVPEENLARMAEFAAVGSAPPVSSEFQPMFFHSQCPSEKYYGWRCVYEERGLRIVRKRLGIFSKYLFMCQGFDNERLSLLVNDRRFCGPTDIQVIHDFSRPANEAGLTLGMRQFDYCPHDRILNIGTFVLDLDQPEEQIWQKFDSNTRNKVRRAIKEGIRIRISTHPHQEDICAFFDFYRPLAKRAGLGIPSQQLVEEMIAAGDLICASAATSDSTVVAVNLIYLCPPYAYDVWGASSSNRVNGAGHLLRWEGVRWLQDRDVKWYDLGGVATTDPSDPIYSFKKTLGGQYVSLGSEYRSMGELTKLVYSGFRLTKELVRRVSRHQY